MDPRKANMTTDMQNTAPAGLAAFYNEKLELYLDGELQERPRTPFS
jgi:hypothetical protein